jgi:addiction module RelE/StbE family toxin
VRRRLLRTNAFLRAVRKFLKREPLSTQALEDTLSLLGEDAFSARLKTHKLKGDLVGVWACSAGYDLRVLFEFVKQDDGEAILLLTVGTHDEVY